MVLGDKRWWCFYVGKRPDGGSLCIRSWLRQCGLLECNGGRSLIGLEMVERGDGSGGQTPNWIDETVECGFLVRVFFGGFFFFWFFSSGFFSPPFVMVLHCFYRKRMRGF